MSTPPYSPTPSPVPSTPVNIPLATNVSPIRGGPLPRTDYITVAKNFEKYIMTDRIEPALRELDNLRKESQNSEPLNKLYTDITRYMKQHFCSETGTFNTLFVGGKRKNKRKTRRSK